MQNYLYNPSSGVQFYYNTKPWIVWGYPGDPTSTPTPTPGTSGTSTPTLTPGTSSTSTLTLISTATPTPRSTQLLGDINGDGFVDIRDYGIWRQSFGQTNCGNAADLNGDCIVDIRDYGIWRANFGHTAGAAPRGAVPGAPPTSTATPMPRAGSPPASPWGGSPWGVVRQAVQVLGSLLPPALLLQGIP